MSVSVPSVPHLIKYTGTLSDGRGYPASAPVDLTFSLYTHATVPGTDGEEPLWRETQHVTPNDNGVYTVYLGAATPAGLPSGIFTSISAQYLGIKAEGLPEQPRTLLVSVPYALKSGDAQTLGGLPASAYALAGAPAAAADSTTEPDIASAVTTTGGTTGYLPQYSGLTTIVDSPLFVEGSNIGIGTKTPSATLQVNGTTALNAVSVAGTLKMDPSATATATLGEPSQQQQFQASAYSSTLKNAVPETFAWQALPVKNNTTTASGALNLLFATGTATPSATGLSIASNGLLNFATGQLFPGTGNGTITGLTTTSPLSGSGTSGSVALSLNLPSLETSLNTKYAQLAAANTFTGLIKFAAGQTFPGTGKGTITAVTPATGLTGGGSSGAITLAIDPTKVPLLSAANFFAGANSFSVPIHFAASQTFANTASLTSANTFTGTNTFSSPIKFAAGQTFPGTGTITGLTAGAALTGGGTTGTVTLSLDTTRVPLLSASNTFLGTNSFANPIQFAAKQTFPGTITGVTAGSGLTGAGTSGNVTLSLNTTTLALLASANSYAATQTISNGDLDLPPTTSAASGVIAINGQPFVHDYPDGQQNTFIGGAGNFTTTGSSTTAEGYGALSAQTSGAENTAVGASSLGVATAGTGNTAVGYQSLLQNATGSSNTALGAAAGTSTDGFTNATAIGASAVVSQNNSLVLGNTTAGSPGTEFVNVGIGTDTPISALEINVNAPAALGPTITLANRGGSGTASIDFNTNIQGEAGFSPTSRIVESGNEYSSIITFLTSSPVSEYGPQLQTTMVVAPNSVSVTNATLKVEGPSGQITRGLLLPGGGQTGLTVTGGSGGDKAGDGGDFVAGLTDVITGGTGSYGGTFLGGSVSPITGSGGTLTGGDGIYATGGDPSPFADTTIINGNAGTFNGDVSVSGTLTAATKDFKIDHPLDPANKYLIHSSVESSEMMNIYTGNIVTDELGLATIQLPEWFEAENTDFRYQLTVIGRQAQAWVATEVAQHRFQIATSATHVKVSWQITAVRQDAYAKAHPLVVEQPKPSSERGYYLNPELFGQPKQKQTEWARHPQQMQRMEATRAAQKSNQNKPETAPPMESPSSAVGRHFHPRSMPTPTVKPADLTSKARLLNQQVNPTP